MSMCVSRVFFFNDTATTEIYTLSLHDALPICRQLHTVDYRSAEEFRGQHVVVVGGGASATQLLGEISRVTSTTWVTRRPDRKSTRLNSSHANISYAVFCLKKKNKQLKYTQEHI